MPFTFSHPAIVVPFLRSKIKFSATALIIGSIVPDYEFFFQLKQVENIGHHGIGIFLLDIPLAYLLCYFFHNVLRNKLIQNLPFFFKSRFVNGINFNWNIYARKNKIIIFRSICIGILSHFFLDAFTHYDGFVVENVLFFKNHFEILQHPIPVFFLLQILLSITGLFYIAFVIKKIPSKKQVLQNGEIDYFFWGSIAALFICIMYIRIIMLPNANTFWSIVLAVIGAFHYAWFITSIIYKINSKLKFLMLVLLIGGTGIQAQNNLNKENFLNKALTYRQNQDYKAALQQLDSILFKDPKDANILLLKGDVAMQAKLFGKAIATYTTLLPLQFETTITTINLSYALFMNHHPAKALHFAKMAYLNDSSNTNAIVNYFNAMLWNLKTNEANNFFKKVKSKLNQELSTLLQARLYTSSGDFKKGLVFYDLLTKQFPNKYYILEYAEVLLGKKEWNRSEQTMKANQFLFSNKELEQYHSKLKGFHKKNCGNETIFFQDIAKNVRNETSIWWQDKETKQYRIMLKAGLGNIASANNEQTNLKNMSFHLDERFSNVLTGSTDLNYQQIQIVNGFTYNAITGKKLIQYKPNDRKMLGMYFSSDILNFTASLLSENIRINNVGYTIHTMLNGTTGIYSEGSYGFLNDQNKRTNVFASIYKLIRTEPTLKTGLNGTYLSFKNNTSTHYFAPNSFKSAEAFLDYSNASTSKMLLITQIGAGVQKIEKQPWQSSLRFLVELGYRSKLIDFSIKYQTTNTAAASGTGYGFNWITGKIMYKF